MKTYFYLTIFLLIIASSLKAQRIYQTSAREIGVNQIDEFKAFLALPNDAAKKEQIEANIIWAEQQLASLGFDFKRLKTAHLPLLLANKIVKKKLPTITFYIQLQCQEVVMSKCNQADP